MSLMQQGAYYFDTNQEEVAIGAEVRYSLTQIWVNGFGGLLWGSRDPEDFREDLSKFSPSSCLHCLEAEELGVPYLAHPTYDEEYDAAMYTELFAAFLTEHLPDAGLLAMLSTFVNHKGQTQESAEALVASINRVLWADGHELYICGRRPARNTYTGRSLPALDTVRARAVADAVGLSDALAACGNVHELLEELAPIEGFTVGAKPLSIAECDNWLASALATAQPHTACLVVDVLESWLHQKGRVVDRNVIRDALPCRWPKLKAEEAKHSVARGDESILSKLEAVLSTHRDYQGQFRKNFEELLGHVVRYCEDRLNACKIVGKKENDFRFDPHATEFMLQNDLRTWLVGSPMKKARIFSEFPNIGGGRCDIVVDWHEYRTIIELKKHSGKVKSVDARHYALQAADYLRTGARIALLGILEVEDRKARPLVRHFSECFWVEQVANDEGDLQRLVVVFIVPGNLVTPSGHH